MNKDNKIVLGAILILLVCCVIFTSAGDMSDVTGQSFLSKLKFWGWGKTREIREPTERRERKGYEPPTTIIKEQVKCIFDNSNTKQKCYSSDGKYVCYGVETCTVDVSGTKDTKLTWKSSCGGYAYTIIDGKSEYAKFECGEEQIPPTPIPPKPEECYDSDGLNLGVRGKTGVGDDYKFDECKGNTLIEYYCRDKYHGGDIAYDCPYNYFECVRGACVPKVQEVPVCTDSDGGKDYYVKGYVYGDLSPFGTGYEGKIGTVYDFCVQLDADGTYPWVNEPSGDNTWNRHEVNSCTENCAIYEMSCKDGRIWTIAPNCPNGCQNGACISEEIPALEKFYISDIEGIKKFYPTLSEIELVVKGVEPDGTPTTPEEGFNVQFSIDMWPLVSGRPSQGGNARYSDGYWYIATNSPDEVGDYRLIIYLYCSRDEAICAKLYGKAAQVENTYYFSTT